MADPLVKIRMESFQPKAFAGKTREIDLGFARFSLPENVRGEAVQMDNGLFVVLDNGSKPSPIFFGPPVWDDDEETQTLLIQFRQLVKEPTATMFEMRKRILSTQPFSAWSIVTRGVEPTKRDAVLLAMKPFIAHPAKSVIQLYESERLGVFVATGDELTVITICDKQRKGHQAVFVAAQAVNLDEFIGALVYSYEFLASEFTEAKLVKLLKATGIRSRPSVSAATNAAPEASRYEEIAQKIRERHKGGKKGP